MVMIIVKRIWSIDLEHDFIFDAEKYWHMGDESKYGVYGWVSAEGDGRTYRGVGYWGRKRMDNLLQNAKVIGVFQGTSYLEVVFEV